MDRRIWVAENGGQSGYSDAVVQAGGNYVEKVNVYGGNQALPFFYDNTPAAFFRGGTYIGRSEGFPPE